jgi:hypothetical protein
MKKLINSLKPIIKNNSEKKKQESLEDISKKRMLSSGKMNEFLRTKFETKNGSFKNSNMQKLASSSEKNIKSNCIEEQKNAELYSNSLKKSSSIKLLCKENSVYNNSLDWRTDFNIADDRSKDSKYEECKQKSKLILDNLKYDQLEQILISSTKSFNRDSNNRNTTSSPIRNKQDTFKITLKNDNNSRNEINNDHALDSNRYFTHEKPAENSIYIKMKVPLARKFSSIYTKLKDKSKSNSSLKKSESNSIKKSINKEEPKQSYYTVSKIIDFSIEGCENIENKHERLRVSKYKSDRLEKIIYRDEALINRKIENYFNPKIYGVNHMNKETDNINFQQFLVSPKVGVSKMNNETHQTFQSKNRSPSSKSRYKEIIETALGSPKPERVIKIDKIRFNSPETYIPRPNKEIKSFIQNTKFDSTVIKNTNNSPSKGINSKKLNNIENFDNFFSSRDNNKSRIKDLKEINFQENNKIKYNILKDIVSIHSSKILKRPFSEKFINY